MYLGFFPVATMKLPVSWGSDGEKMIFDLQCVAKIKS